MSANKLSNSGEREEPKKIQGPSQEKTRNNTNLLTFQVNGEDSSKFFDIINIIINLIFLVAQD